MVMTARGMSLVVAEKLQRWRDGRYGSCRLPLNVPLVMGRRGAFYSGVLISRRSDAPP